MTAIRRLQRGTWYYYCIGKDQEEYMYPRLDAAYIFDKKESAYNTYERLYGHPTFDPDKKLELHEFKPQTP